MEPQQYTQQTGSGIANEVNNNNENAGEYEYHSNIDVGNNDSLLSHDPKDSSLNPLLASHSVFHYLQDKFQPGGIKGSVFTLTMVTVGAGSLALAYAFRNVGLVNGLILLGLAYCCTFASLHMLIQASIPLGNNVRPSYQELSKATYGNWLVKFSSFALMINLFGSVVSYLVASGTIVDLVYIVVFNHNDSDINRAIYTYTVIGVSTCLVLPFALLRSLSALRFTAFLGLCCVSYLSIVLVVSYFRLCHTFYETCFWETHKFHLSHDQLFKFQIQGFLKAWPIIVFAFTCHPNVLPIYVELQRRTPKRMHKVFRRALTIALTLYCMIAASGYLVFLDGTCGNILINNFHQHIEVVIAAVAIGTSLLCSSPLLVFAFRQEFTLLVFDKPEVDSVPHFLVTFICIACAAAIAISVTDISIVFGFIGSTSTPTIAFLLPAIFYLKLATADGEEEKKQLRRKKIFFFIFTCVLGFVSLCSLSYNTVTYIFPNYDVNSNCANEQKV